MDRPYWAGQLDRAKRWRDRVGYLLAQSGEMDLLLLQDSLFAFFINCYHVADWLFEAGVRDAKKFARTDEHIDICRGICNGAKHFTIRQEEYQSEYHRMSIETPQFSLLSSSTGRDDMEPHLRATMMRPVECTVSTEKGDLEVRVLMDKCVEAWERFIRANGLTPP